MAQHDSLVIFPKMSPMRGGKLAIFFSSLVLLLAVAVGIFCLFLPSAIAKGHWNVGMLIHSRLFLILPIPLSCLIAPLVWRQKEGRLAAVTGIILSVFCGLILLQSFPASWSSGQFLKHFSKRVSDEVGSITLNNFLSQLQADLGKGLIQEAPLNRNRIPSSVRELFRTPQPYGYLNFHNEKMERVEIFWGGPAFRWGIEICPSEPSSGGDKALRHLISTNISCFIAK